MKGPATLLCSVSSIDSSSMSSTPDVEELQPSQALPIDPSKRSSSRAEEGHATSPEREQPASSSKAKLSKKDKKGVKRQGQVRSKRAKLEKEFLEEMRSTQEKFLEMEKKRMEREELEDMKRREWEAEQDKRREEFFLKMLSVMAKKLLITVANIAEDSPRLIDTNVDLVTCC